MPHNPRTMQPVASPRQAAPDVQPGWFDSAAAKRLLEWERRAVIPKLTALYGCHGLYLRPSAAVASELSGNMLQGVISLYRDARGFSGDLECRDEALPVMSESLALVYAQHVFETSQDGEALAQELGRLLAPEGTALIMLLNPLSPWRLRWQGRGFAPPGLGLMNRWLAEAGLEPMGLHGAGPVLPWQMSVNEDVEKRSLGLSGFRASQLLIARKRRHGLTPLRSRGAIRLAAQAGPG